MATWEIMLLEHPSMQVDADDQRDLAAEYHTHVSRRIRTRADRLWTPVAGVIVNAGMVLAVRKVSVRKRTKPKPGIGFSSD